MLLQICLIAACTIVSVFIMYVHSAAAFDQPVSACLLAITCLTGSRRRVDAVRDCRPETAKFKSEEVT